MNDWRRGVQEYQTGVQSVAQSNLQEQESLLQSRASLVSAGIGEKVGEATTTFGDRVNAAGQKFMGDMGVDLSAGAVAPVLLKGAAGLANWRSRALNRQWKRVNAQRFQDKDQEGGGKYTDEPDSFENASPEELARRGNVPAGKELQYNKKIKMAKGPKQTEEEDEFTETGDLPAPGKELGDLDQPFTETGDLPAPGKELGDLDQPFTDDTPVAPGTARDDWLSPNKNIQDGGIDDTPLRAELKTAPPEEGGIDEEDDDAGFGDDDLADFKDLNAAYRSERGPSLSYRGFEAEADEGAGTTDPYFKNIIDDGFQSPEGTTSASADAPAGLNPAAKPFVPGGEGEGAAGAGPGKPPSINVEDTDATITTDATRESNITQNLPAADDAGAPDLNPLKSQEAGITEDVADVATDLAPEISSAMSAARSVGSFLGDAIPFVGFGLGVYGLISGAEDINTSINDGSADPYAAIRPKLKAAQNQITGLETDVSADEFASKIGARAPQFGSIAASPNMDTAKMQGVALHV